jgi:hypothetical protein
MKNELIAWNQLNDKASAQLHPQFAQHVMRAARLAAETAPSLMSYMTLSAATLVVCFLALTYVHHVEVIHNDSHQSSDWQQVISIDEESSLLQ